MKSHRPVHDFTIARPRRSAARFLNPLLLAALLALAACATDTPHREGMSLMMEGRYEEGLARLQQAAQADPKNIETRQDYYRAREQALTRVLDAAGGELANERYDSADGLYRRALAIEPANAAAQSGLTSVAAARRHAQWLIDAQMMAKKGDLAGAKSAINLILIERPTHVKANQMRYQLEEQSLKENLAGPRLNIKGRKPVTLQFRDANLKMVLEAISRTTGVNIMIDKDVRNDIKVSIFVKDTPVEETLDLILLQNQLEKRVLGENTVLVYPFTPAKSKDYQELKVRRFALVNADPKQVQSMIKTILKTKDVYVDERSNAVVIRDTAQAIRLAEKLVASMDHAEPEVMLQVELLDVNRQRAMNLGLDLPNSSTAKWSFTGTTLADFLGKSASTIGFAITPLVATLNASGSDSDTKTLATPRIRVRNKEKAKIMIGDRTPVISSAAVPGSGVTTNPVFNTNIQYLETGVKLEVEPVVYLDGTVAIRLNLEVSKLGAKTTTDSGTVAYATTTNNAITVLRLKDGETQVLGGLISAQDSHGQANKVAGLGDLPFFGRLFGSGQDEWGNRELVLAITPHIVRNNQENEADLLELWSGTEANVKFFAPDLKLPAAAAVLSPGAGGSGAGPLGTRGLPAPLARAMPVRPTAPLVNPAALGGTLSLALSAPAQAKIGDKINVAINANGGAPVSALSFTLNYDSASMKATAVVEGEMTRRPGVKASFEGEIDELNGKVTGLVAAEAGGAAASGLIASVQFEVIGEGSVQLSASGVSAAAESGEALQVTMPPPVSINIAP